MKYLVSLLQIIIIGCFCYPISSFAGCEGINKNYNFFDIIVGKDTGDLIDCINKIMEDNKKTAAPSSIAGPAIYYSPASPHLNPDTGMKSELWLSDAKNYNYQLEYERMEVLSSSKTVNEDALIYCH